MLRGGKWPPLKQQILSFMEPKLPPGLGGEFDERVWTMKAFLWFMLGVSAAVWAIL